MDTYYRANRKLRILNAPGSVPSSVRVETGEVFVLDGTEPLDVALLLRSGAVTRLDGPPAEVPERQERPKRRPAIRRQT